MTAPGRPAIPPVGLCAQCRHARPTVSHRGSTFWRCGLHEQDPRFAKYPRLPVLACDGYAAGGESDAAGRAHVDPTAQED